MKDGRLRRMLKFAGTGERESVRPSGSCPSAAQRIDGAPFGRCHQPRAGVFGDAFFGPEFERSHQGVLGQLFCDADIVSDSGNGGDEPWTRSSTRPRSRRSKLLPCAAMMASRPAGGR